MGQKLRKEELNRINTEDFKSAQKNPVIIVLDNVRSLNNVGSVFRTADAFLIESIYLCGVTGQPPNKEIEKTALGSTQSVDWKFFSNTLEAVTALREKNYKVYSIEQAVASIPLNKFNGSNEPLGLVFGNEVYGVAQDVIDRSDGVIEIPQQGTKHSLN